jgi:hypothetical protein
LRITVGQVKFFHALIFAFQVSCIFYALYCGIANQITLWTWGALAIILVESLILMALGWKCPLTTLAERMGAENGSVAEYFMPQWFADRTFPIFGTIYVVACALVGWRALA